MMMNGTLFVVDNIVHVVVVAAAAAAAVIVVLVEIFVVF